MAYVYAMKNIRNLYAFISNPISFLDELAQHDLPIIRAHLGHRAFVFIFDAFLAREVLTSHAPNFVQNRSIFDRIKPITGNRGVVQLEGEASRKTRKKILPLFHRKGLSYLEEIIQEIACQHVLQMKDRTQIDIAQEMTHLVLKTALAMFVGRANEKNTQEMARLFLDLNKLCGKKMLSPISLPQLVPTPTNLTISKLSKNLRKKVMATLLENKKDNQSISSLFKEDESLVDQCLTFLFAGHETTASSIVFTLMLLAKYPQYQHFIRNKDERMTKAIYQEALRMYPPAYMLVRQAVNKTSLGGQIVKANDQVVIALKQIHNNEKYFSNSSQFYPERFIEATHHPYSYFPFGKGAKSCIGEKLAYLEAQIILQRICEEFQITPNFQNIGYRPLVTLHPEKVQFLNLVPIINNQRNYEHAGV